MTPEFRGIGGPWPVGAAALSRWWLVAFVAVTGAWFGGAVATGQRGVGLSLAWLVPAVVSAIVVGVAMVVASIMDPSSGGDDTPPTPTPTPNPAPSSRERGVTFPRVPKDVAGAAVVVAAIAVGLWASNGLNHAWATSPRGRLAVLAPVAVAALLPMAWRLGTLTIGRVARLGPMATITAGALAFFMAAASGRLVTPDEWTIYAAAVGLVEHGRLAVFDGEPYRLTMVGTVRGPHRVDGASLGSAPSKYPAVASLIVAPFYAMARLLGAPDPATMAQPPPPERAPLLVTLLVGPATGAALVGATAWLARASGMGGGAVLVASLAVATGSLAWPYASTLLNMGATGAALAGAAAAALHAAITPTWRWFGAAGALLGLAAASRYEYLVIGLPVGALLLRAAVTGTGWSTGILLPSSAGRGWGRGWGSVPVPWLATVLARLVWAAAGWGVVVVPLVFGWNVARTGSPFDFGYGDEGLLASFLEKPWYGWYGLLFSPGCGVLVHAPLMIAGAVALAWLWEDSRPVALASAATMFLAVAYFGSVSSTWCAQPTWGPRYLVAVAPLALLPIASLWSRLVVPPWRRNPFAWLALGAPWAANVAANLLAVLVDFGRGWQDHWALGATYQVAAWVPYFSGVTAHVRLLRAWVSGGEASIDVLWLRGPGGTPTVGGAFTMVALLVVAAMLAGRAWALASRAEAAVLLPSPAPAGERPSTRMTKEGARAAPTP